jgi:hypothetical protein
MLAVAAGAVLVLAGGFGLALMIAAIFFAATEKP